MYKSWISWKPIDKNVADGHITDSVIYVRQETAPITMEYTKIRNTRAESPIKPNLKLKPVIIKNAQTAPLSLPNGMVNSSFSKIAL